MKISSLGSSCGEITVDECIKLVAESVNFVHKQTSYVTLGTLSQLPTKI